MKKERNSKAEEILNSLDGIRKMEAPDFFFTRLGARMIVQNQGSNKEQNFSRDRKWILRPVYAVAMLTLLVVVNAVILFQRNDNDVTFNTINADDESQQTIASAYIMNDNLLYDINH
jgi:hypothetical protein